MNKSELIAALVEKTEFSKKDAEKALNAFVDVISDSLKKNEKDCCTSNIIDAYTDCCRNSCMRPEAGGE